MKSIFLIPIWYKRYLLPISFGVSMRHVPRHGMNAMPLEIPKESNALQRQSEDGFTRTIYWTHRFCAVGQQLGSAESRIITAQRGFIVLNLPIKILQIQQEPIHFFHNITYLCKICPNDNAPHRPSTDTYQPKLLLNVD
ncbi:hypothetical protein DBV15_10663 [Temnothorax longispinosus]|uniref:Uncharacterized protein n=1 Tax=Temnothorax longispinosus TaxID=300112 RepID=A0A4S2KXA3_9HYME|nr:hypothetical protein DBV15_10663 [Temnothorax longispinosus]